MELPDYERPHEQDLEDAPMPARDEQTRMAELAAEGDRLRARSHDLVQHARELTERSQRLREEASTVWDAVSRIGAAATDEPAVEIDPEA
jgi:uncharacterized coiled-coil DUF342 family protein